MNSQPMVRNTETPHDAVPSQYDYATLYEEWLLHHQKLQEQVQQQQQSEEQSGNNNNCLYARALVARAGRMGTIQCAVWDKPPSETDEFLRGILERMELNVDGEFSDGDFHGGGDGGLSNLLLPDYALDAAAKNSNRSVRQRQMQAAVQNMNGSTSSIELALADVNVDAYFDEYPECVRVGWDAAQEMESDSDDEDDGGDDGDRNAEIDSKRGHPQPLRKKLSVVAASSNSITGPATCVPDTRPFQKSQLEDQQTHQRQPRGASVSAESILYSQNNYEDLTDRDNETKDQNTYTYNRTNIHVASAETSQLNPYRNVPQQHQEQNIPPSQPKNPNANVYPINNDHKQQNPTFTNTESWDDYTREQNPFQTARELADANRHQHHPHQQQQQQQQTHDNQNTNPYRNSQQYNQYQQQHSYPRVEENEANSPIVQGPVIRESLKRKFIPPTIKRGGNGSTNGNGNVRQLSKNLLQKNKKNSSRGKENNSTNMGDDDDDDDNASGEEEELPEELKRFGKELVDKIKSEIMYNGEKISFDDIAGLADAKATILEIVCWPMKRPDLFTGLRRTPRGLLLFGPPGTGKTLIGKAIAHESGATFFSISSSSLTSKWIGEGEKLVKTLFGVASYYAPAVVFIDEIDSLLTQRKSDDNEASRRIKTEFLVQLDGTGTGGQGQVLVIGATNRPQELDEAARRRFVKRLYIPLPDEKDRACLLRVLLKTNAHTLTEDDILKMAADTQGFSGADLKSLSADAAMGPIRQLGLKALETPADEVPPISFNHFRQSLRGMHPSVSPDDITQYKDFDNKFGSKRASEQNGEERDGDK